MRHHQFVAALAAGAALMASTACSSSNTGTATPSATPAGAAGASASAASTAPTSKPEPLSPDQVASAVKTAYQGASAVHVKGSQSYSDSAAAVDLQLNKDSGSGSMRIDGVTYKVTWVNGVYYVKCTDALLSIMNLSPTSGPGAALRDKWLSSDHPLSSRIYSIKDSLSYNGYLQGTIGSMDGETFTAAGSGTLNGIAAYIFKAADGSTAYLAASSPHYLLRASGPPSDPSVLDFTGWNHPLSVTAPPASEIYSGPAA